MQPLFSRKRVCRKARVSAVHIDFQQKCRHTGRLKFTDSTGATYELMFLYENGLTSKNGKPRCATSLGKKYVIKAIQYKNHSLIQKNLGRIFFDQQDYPSALRWFSFSYEQAKDDIVLYNLALSLIELHEYTFEINRKAVNILCQGDFDRAQEVFYQNKNMFPGYQSSRRSKNWSL